MDLQNPKLKKLAFLIADDMDDFKSNSTASFKNFGAYAREREDYFKKMNAIEFLLLFFMVWSIKTSGGLEFFYEQILNNIFFSTFFLPQNEHPETFCDRCSGDGREECNECDGQGMIECGDCDGKGTISCSECNGEKEVENDEGVMVQCEVCDGTGVEDCWECDGEGKVDCRDCDGGSITCLDCDGNGNIEESDENIYSIIFVVSWNKELENFCKNNTNNLEGVEDGKFNQDYLDQDDVLELSSSDGSGELESSEEVEKIYCMRITDEPVLKLNNNFTIRDDSRQDYKILRDYYLA